MKLRQPVFSFEYSGANSCIREIEIYHVCEIR
jgi:hypothetical protein